MKILSSQYISKHKYFTAKKDTYQTESGKIVDPYYIVEMPPSACAFAITEDKKVLLVRQFRYPVDKMLHELPGGFIDEGEAADKAIARELQEETGYHFSEIISIGHTFANPGVLNNKTFLFLALNGEKTTEQSLDENEEIEIILKSLGETKSMLENSEIEQSMHALCMYRAFEYINAHLPEYHLS